ncbi:hypothetical protein EPUL_002672 [Erysiphe pulchra]|uniref:Uncharacterized protein n=1 Tax=Erysiphe pulchra TaxID=225359 RepID=A0A2S4PZB4_9PEZI|nr:hypothetical protein EPUL_002672 [Erysiphe pulchra]
MSNLFGTEKHEGFCAQPRRCLNFRGPYEFTSFFCPARSCYKNGVSVRPTGTQLKLIRIARRKDFTKALYIENLPESISDCLHTKILKRANVIILPKSGRRDRSLPTLYRPIALLFCLDKGLERLLARRMAYCASKYEILAQNKCGAVMQRSAVDLKTALIFDIRKVLQDGKVAEIATVDVKGAFDSVLCYRLLHRLRTQGWSETLTKWVFIHLPRKIRPRSIRPNYLQTFLYPLWPTLGILPILFLLYVEPFFRLSRYRFGYADGDYLEATSRILEEHGNLKLTSTRIFNRDVKMMLSLMAQRQNFSTFTVKEIIGCKEDLLQWVPTIILEMQTLLSSVTVNW